MALLATLGLALAQLAAGQAPLVQQIEARLLDLRFRLRPPAPPSDEILLVLIDDASIRALGRWPWSRAVVAKALGRLRSAGAGTIGIDLLFAEPEPGPVPASWLERLRQAARGLDDGSAAGTEAARTLTRFLDESSGDAELAAALRAAGNVVLPFSFGFGAPAEAAPPAPPPAVAATAFRVVHGPSSAPSALPLVATSLLAPLPQLAAAAQTLGHGNVDLDRDGAARFEFPAVAYGERAYPSFALEVARQHLGVPRDQVRLELGRGVWLGERLVPTDPLMRLLVNYRGPERFRAVSFADLLEGELPAPDLAGKVVLVGGSATGVGERFLTPFTAVMPGVERHAAVVGSILANDFLVRPDGALLLDLGLVVLGGVLIGSSASRRGLLAASLVFALICAATVALNLYAFIALGQWLDLFLPLAALVAVYLLVVAYGYFVEQRQERIIRAAFKHYLSPTLVDQVARDPGLLRLGGERRELSVLFADLRDSTRLAAALEPERFAELLNEVFAALTDVLFEHGGMLDKFVGDGLVAIFGAPLPQPDHALRACRAALAMQAALEPLRERWSRPGLPPVELGIGINSGPMIIGNMGSKERFSYTVIGDEAHLGARIEAANKDFRTRILISEATWRAVAGRRAAPELDQVTITGLDRPVRGLELLGEEPLPAREAHRVERFAAALAAYRSGQCAAAEARFRELLAMTPADRPSQLYLERCRQHLARVGSGSAAPGS